MKEQLSNLIALYRMYVNSRRAIESKRRFLSFQLLRQVKRTIQKLEFPQRVCPPPHFFITFRDRIFVVGADFHTR